MAGNTRPSPLKQLAQAISLLLVLPWAAVALFGRFRIGYDLGAHSLALAPGVIGDYLRIAYYRLTLRECSLFSRISFGSFFVHPETRIAHSVYIGSNSILGKCSIGARTQIASAVQILSGRHQHARDQSGQIGGSETGRVVEVRIGSDCWIGAAAIVMADVGDGSTVGAGSVVTKPVPPGVVVAGNPARILRPATGQPADGDQRTMVAPQE
jgi:acetyltransferase-like isoleucine patch superfamily enzyme